MKMLFTLLLGCVFTVSIQAQEFNTIPSSQETRSLNEGWHKFNLEGVAFDVEVRAGSYAQGNLKWFDGSQYSGALLGTELAGTGTYTWTDGNKYEGSFKKNQRNGKGTLISADRTKWSGKWKENKKNGKGKFIDADGNILKEGFWKSDEFVVKK